MLKTTLRSLVSLNTENFIGSEMSDLNGVPNTHAATISLNPRLLPLCRLGQALF